MISQEVGILVPLLTFLRRQWPTVYSSVYKVYSLQCRCFFLHIVVVVTVYRVRIASEQQYTVELSQNAQ